MHFIIFSIIKFKYAVDNIRVDNGLIFFEEDTCA